MNEAAMLKQARKLWDKWAPILGIADWDVTISLNSDMSATDYADVHADPRRRHADITIGSHVPGELGKSQPSGYGSVELEDLVVHEMLHILETDAISEWRYETLLRLVEHYLPLEVTRQVEWHLSQREELRVHRLTRAFRKGYHG